MIKFVRDKSALGSSCLQVFNNTRHASLSCDESSLYIVAKNDYKPFELYCVDNVKFWKAIESNFDYLKKSLTVNQLFFLQSLATFITMNNNRPHSLEENKEYDQWKELLHDWLYTRHKELALPRVIIRLCDRYKITEIKKIINAEQMRMI